MKTIGILGGMSWESTLIYYQLINQKVKEVLKGSHSARILMYSFDYDELEKLLEKNDWDEITKRLSDEAIRLKNAGAQYLLIAANTMHIVAADVEKLTQMKIIYITQAALEKAKKLDLKKILLLGTKYTMKSPLYKDLFMKEHIEIVVPHNEEQEIIHNIIYKELILGVFNQKSKQAMIDIISNHMLQGVDGVILGCTEIPLLIHDDDLSIPLLNTLKLHAEYAVKYILEDETS